MKILLDTTYLLPAIGISIRGLRKEAVLNILKRGHEVLVSQVTIFELSAKGAKYVVEGKLSADRVCRGIKAVVYDDRIKIIPMHDTSILLTAFKLRRNVSDFIDCIIISSAINSADMLLTEDEDIHNKRKEIQSLKPEFKIRKLKDITQL